MGVVVLLELFDSFYRWQSTWASSRAKLIGVVGLMCGAVLVVVGMLFWDSVPAVGVIAGGTAGLLWLAAVWLLWWRLAPTTVQQRANLRELLALSQRRLVSSIAAVVWLLGMAVVGRSAGDLGSLVVVVGAVNVVVLVSIAHVFVANPAERAEWTQEKEDEWRQRAYEKAVKDGLVNPQPTSGHPEAETGSDEEAAAADPDAIREAGASAGSSRRGRRLRGLFRAWG